MFERFTEASRNVVVEAQSAACELGHSYLGTEHLLLGLLASPDSSAGQILGELGVSRADALRIIESVVGRSDCEISGQLPMTPRAKDTLDLALKEALGLGAISISPLHILLALVDEGEGVGARILLDLGADRSRLREKAATALGLDQLPAPPQLARRRSLEIPSTRLVPDHWRRLPGWTYYATDPRVLRRLDALVGMTLIALVLLAVHVTRG